MSINFSVEKQKSYKRNSEDNEEFISVLGITVCEEKWNTLTSLSNIQPIHCSATGAGIKDIRPGNILAGSTTEDGYLSTFYRIHSVSHYPEIEVLLQPIGKDDVMKAYIRERYTETRLLSTCISDHVLATALDRPSLTVGSVI